MNSIYDNLVPFSKNPHYLSRYIKFISRCQSRVLDARVYIEKHHIHPTSLGGDNSVRKSYSPDSKGTFHCPLDTMESNWRKDDLCLYENAK